MTEVAPPVLLISPLTPAQKLTHTIAAANEPAPDFEPGDSPKERRQKAADAERNRLDRMWEYHRSSAKGQGYQLRLLGDPILTTPTVPVMDLELLDRPMIGAMWHTVNHPGYGQRPGLGIAANQVGGGQSVAIVRLDGAPCVMINPRIHDRSPQLTMMAEGCLSIPDFHIGIPRSAWVDIEWTDESWSTFFRRVGSVKTSERGAQLEARILQHECDHLRGVQIVDGLGRPQRRRADKFVQKALSRSE